MEVVTKDPVLNKDDVETIFNSWTNKLGLAIKYIPDISTFKISGNYDSSFSNELSKLNFDFELNHYLGSGSMYISHKDGRVFLNIKFNVSKTKDIGDVFSVFYNALLTLCR